MKIKSVGVTVTGTYYKDSLAVCIIPNLYLYWCLFKKRLCILVYGSIPLLYKSYRLNLGIGKVCIFYCLYRSHLIFDPYIFMTVKCEKQRNIKDTFKGENCTLKAIPEQLPYKNNINCYFIIHMYRDFLVHIL